MEPPNDKEGHAKKEPQPPQSEGQAPKEEKPEGERTPKISGEYDAERAMNTIAALREEVRQLKDKNRQLAADAGSVEGLKAENESLRIVNDALGRGLGPQESQDASYFVDRTVWSVDSDAAFAALRKQRPYLFRGRTPDTGPTNPRRKYQSSLTHADLRNMSYEEIQARQPEIDRLLKSGSR